MKTTADIRRLARPLLILLALLLLGALAMHRLALWQYDSLLGQRALHDLSLRLRQDTPFHWPLQHPGELTGEVHGLGEPQWQDGSLHIRPENTDPHFSLALADRRIDAGYDRLQIGITVSAGTRLQVFHRVAETADFVFGSQWIDLRAGDNRLVLDLPQLRWYAVPITDAGRDLPKPEARWGGASGVITELRIDPANRQDVQLQLHDIRLQRSRPWPAVNPADFRVVEGLPAAPAGTDIVVLDAQGFAAQQAWLREHRHDPLLLADGNALRTPELGLRLRSRVLAEVPQAVWLPRVPTAGDLERLQALQAGTAEPDARWVWDAARWPAAIVAVLLAAAYLAVRARRGPPWLQAALIPALAACLWVNGRSLGEASGLLALAAVLACALAYWRQQPGDWAQRVGLRPAPAAAWRETAWLTLPAVLLLVLLSWLSGHWATALAGPLPRNAWLYPFWVVLQQGFLCAWFAGSIAQAMAVQRHRHWLPLAGGLAGLGFSLLHFPNFGAMITVLFMGTGWACIYLRHRSLWPLVVSHVLLGSLFRLLMPADFRVDGDVGLMYFAWLWY